MKIRHLLIGLLFITAAGCDRHSGFGSTCSEGHPAVSHARSLSNEELEFLYVEMFRLREADADRRSESGFLIEYGSWGEKVPEDLEFLEADRIRPSDALRPNIMLAGCMDEFIYLRFFDSDSEQPRIELSWFDGPYSQQVELLWEPKVARESE